MGNTLTTSKPKFNVEQLVNASTASKNFGSIRKRAKECPQFITENGVVETVLISYDYYEKMYQRLVELEQQDEEKILLERIEQNEKDPTSTVSWKSIRR